MLINSFFKLKFYSLNIGWVNSQSLLNQSIYALCKTQKLIFYDYNLINIRKSLIFLKSLILNSGVLYFLSLHYYFIKNLTSLNYYMLEYNFKNYTRGCFSNFKIIDNIQIIPDSLIVLYSKKNLTFLYEIKTIGIPVINLCHHLNSIKSNEYSVYLNTNSYFVNFLTLQFYARYILLHK